MHVKTGGIVPENAARAQVEYVMGVLSLCLEKAKIKTIGDLVGKTESEMLKYRNFGKKSLNEIIGILDNMGLSLGMKTKKKKWDTAN